MQSDDLIVDLRQRINYSRESSPKALPSSVSCCIKMKRKELLFSFLLLPLNLVGHYLAAAEGDNLDADTRFDVGIVLDLQTPLGNMSASCISMALSDFYADHNRTTKLVPHWRDSKQGIVDAAFAALDLVKNVQVNAIIGPQTSAQLQFVAELGSKAQVPILSFSATSPHTSPTKAPYFVRTASSDLSQIKAITALIDAFGWREVVPIYEDTSYGNGLILDLTIALQKRNIRVPFKSMIPHIVKDDQITLELFKLETMQSRVFIVHLSYILSSRLFLKANEIGMMSEGYVWIVTDGQANLLDSMESSTIQSMQGVVGVRPYVPKSEKLDKFKERWKRRVRSEDPGVDMNELNIICLWAYDTIWALAKVAEEVMNGHSHFIHPHTGKNLADFERVGVSEIGPKILRSILKSKFIGLSGNFSLIHGELYPTAFQIVNVVGRGSREIGFWTPIHGFKKKLDTVKKDYSASKDEIKPIVWPGDSLNVPRGWTVAMNDKKMRIGVPLKKRFREFVDLMQDPTTNETIVKGYSIDVFKAAIERLPYSISYKFVPFVDKNGRRAGNYDDLIYQVYLKNFDAVVGDITILANRSKYVDFTLPYTESGVTLLVPTNDSTKKTWIFLKPLSWELWLTTVAAFIFTGIVIWALEHRVNDEFRGPIADQVGLSLWFSFSTLVFAHRERLVSNLSRIVVIIWLFVVLILSSSYTASLTSMLTIQRLHPNINSIDDLIKNSENVGYQKGNFVRDILRRLNVDESKMKPYDTMDEYTEALSKGMQEGISAVFDEIPYLKIFLAKNGNSAKYRMVGPIYKTGGFAFAFPRGSPLVNDFSRALLNLTETEDMVRIEKKWMVPETITTYEAEVAQSNNLTLGSFCGLFLITGTISLLACAIDFLILYKHRGVVRVPFQQTIVDLIRFFNEKCLSLADFWSTRSNESLAMADGHARNSTQIDITKEPIH